LKAEFKEDFPGKDMSTGSIYTDGNYLAENPAWHLDDSPTKAKWIRGIIPDSMRGSVKSVLEVGCGRGAILNDLRGFFDADCRFEGIDLSGDAIDYARGNFEGIDFHSSDVWNFDFKKYDLILCIDLLEHMYFQEDFMRLVRDSSKFSVFHVPLGDNLKNRLLDRWQRQVRKFGHVQFYNPASIMNLFANSGLAIRDYRYTFALDLPRHGRLRPFFGWLFRLSPYLASQSIGLVSMMMFAESVGRAQAGSGGSR
jgi:SAM-dependent methyltransferase